MNRISSTELEGVKEAMLPIAGAFKAAAVQYADWKNGRSEEPQTEPKISGGLLSAQSRKAGKLLYPCIKQRCLRLPPPPSHIVQVPEAFDELGDKWTCYGLWWLAFVGWLETSDSIDFACGPAPSYPSQVFRFWKPGSPIMSAELDQRYTDQFPSQWLCMHYETVRDYGEEACLQSAAAIAFVSDKLEASLPKADSPSVGPGPEIDQVFRKAGDVWIITYQGETTSLKDSKGLAYIAHLLNCPGRECHVRELYATINGRAHVGNTGKIYSTQSKDQLDEQNLSVTDLGDAGPMLDEDAKKNYESHLSELAEELSEAQENNDEGRIDKVQQEITAITSELDSAIGIGGRSRMIADVNEKTRKSVTNRIASAIEKLQEIHQLLGTHFLRSIKTGMYCSYSPEQPIDWEL